MGRPLHRIKSYRTWILQTPRAFRRTGAKLLEYRTPLSLLPIATLEYSLPGNYSGRLLGYRLQGVFASTRYQYNNSSLLKQEYIKLHTSTRTQLNKDYKQLPTGRLHLSLRLLLCHKATQVCRPQEGPTRKEAAQNATTPWCPTQGTSRYSIIAITRTAATSKPGRRA